jgi:hypothetical protein
MPDQHEVLGFLFEAGPRGLDVVVRCEARHLFCSLGGPEPRRQDFSRSLGAKFSAMFNPVEGQLQVERKSAIFSTARRPSSLRPPLGSCASVLAALCWTR